MRNSIAERVFFDQVEVVSVVPVNEQTVRIYELDEPVATHVHDNIATSEIGGLFQPLESAFDRIAVA